MTRIQLEQLRRGERNLVSCDGAERGSRRTREPRARRNVEEGRAKAAGDVAEGVEHGLTVLDVDDIAGRWRDARLDPVLEVAKEGVEEDVARESAPGTFVAVHGRHRPAGLDDVGRRGRIEPVSYKH